MYEDIQQAISSRYVTLKVDTVLPNGDVVVIDTQSGSGTRTVVRAKEVAQLKAKANDPLANQKGGWNLPFTPFDYQLAKANSKPENPYEGMLPSEIEAIKAKEKEARVRKEAKLPSEM